MKFAISTILASAFLLQDVAGRVIEGRATIEERATATPVKNTGKRGLSYNNAAYTMPFSLSGQDSQVSWAYNWYQVAGSGFNPALEYVPMLWSNASDLTSSWTANAQAAINAGSTHLLGFNEPDLCLAGAGSSCIEMQSAVKAWKQYMQPFAGKALLGSPAVTNGGSPMGLTWLSNFMGNCTGCQIDFINIHWYSNKYAGANYFKQQVEAAHAMSGGRPVWITEFGLDSSVSYTQAELTSFLEEVIEWMDETDYVQRYAYFMDTTGALMNSDGSAMSDLGSMYNSYPEVSSASSSSASPSSSATAVLSTSSSVKTAVPSSVLSSSSAIVVTTSSTYTSSRITSAPTSSLTSSSSSRTSAASSLQTSSSTSSVLSSTTASSKAATSTTSGISILGAYFADKDVTAAAQTAFIQNGNLVVNTYTLASALPVSDPWYGVVKTISILYSDASNNTYIFSSAEQTGTYTISSSSIPSAAKTPSIAPVDGSTINIVGIVWGAQQIKTQSVWDRIYYQQATEWGFQINTGLFGVDGFWGHAKVGVVWYRDAQGVLKSLVSRENGWVKF
ncbi:glycoside hydrolase family 128 protein, partial [Aureobasidium melanogenum]